VLTCTIRYFVSNKKARST